MSGKSFGLFQFVILTAVSAVCVLPVMAVQPQGAADEPPRRVGEPRSREKGEPGRRFPDRQRELRGQQGTEEGMPAVQPRIAPDHDRYRPHRRWRLGVYAYNTSTGVVITGVVPGTPAQRAGLEPGDTIVTVDGYQVGYVNEWVYYLGDELQRQAQDHGHVRLLVKNWRNADLMNLDVRLTRRFPFGTRQRGDEEVGTPRSRVDRQRSANGTRQPSPQHKP